MQNFMVILKILYELVQNYLHKIMMNIFKIIRRISFYIKII